MNLKNLLKKFFALVLVLMCVSVSFRVVASEETNDQVYLLGNCASSGMDDAAIFGFGDGMQHTFGGATMLPLVTLQEKATSVVGIRVYIGAEVETGKVFIGADYTEPELEKEFTYKKGGWQYVLFDQPYTFTKDTYIGFLATGKTDFLALEQGKASKTEMIHIDGKWDLVSNQIGRYFWAIQAIVTGGDYSAERQYDVVLERAAVSKNLKEGDAVTLSCELRGAGIIPAENVKIKCTLGEESKTIDVSEKIMNGQSIVVNFEDFVAPSVDANFEDVFVKFEADYVEDALNSNNKTEAKICVYTSEAVERNAILVEQFTGQGCPNCPGGSKAMATAIAGMADPSKAVWIANHTYGRDEFTVDESLDIADYLYVTYAPACNINRMNVEYVPGSTDFIWHPGYATTALLEDLLKTPSLATMDLSCTYNEESRLLEVTIKGKSLEEKAYITVVLKQDGIVARQSGADSKYVHNNAPRKFLTSAKGDALTLDENGEYSVTYSYVIPDKIGKFSCAGDMALAAFVHGDILSSQKMVYNSDQYVFDVESITAEEYSYSKDMCIYPNPAVDVLYIDGVKAGDIVKIYTIDGVLVKEQEFGSAEVAINVGDLSVGTYFLQLNEKVVKFVKK